MSNTEYKVSIKGEGLTFEQSVPLELAKRLVAMAASGETMGGRVGESRMGGGAGRVIPHQHDGGDHDNLAMSEFISTHDAARNIEKITAIGEYLKVYRGKSTFTNQDVASGFEEAGDAVPKNLSRDVVWAKKVGWVAPKMGADGEYYVTTSGRAAINGNFGPEVKAKSKASAGGRKRKKAAAKTT
jgi:hypothetical protein